MGAGAANCAFDPASERVVEFGLWPRREPVAGEGEAARPLSSLNMQAASALWRDRVMNARVDPHEWVGK